MRIVVTGAGGQLGRELVDAAARRGHDVVGTTRADLDVCDLRVTRARLVELRPDLVVHAAAWTAVDACESDPERAMRDNGEATANVVDGAEACGAKVMYVSTDYVFDGTKPTPYVETDAPNPKSVYGESKLAGERAMRESDAIVRISWVCGFHGNNMVKTIMRLMGNNPTLAFVDDQIGHPSFADDVAEAMVSLAERDVRGIWHLTNQGVVSWYEFAREVVALCGGDPAIVTPIATSQLNPPRPAARPANSVLDNAAMRSAGLPLLDDFRVPLARLVRRLREQAKG
jgi:dTDP-4-dehydrorhamnose reductase